MTALLQYVDCLVQFSIKIIIMLNTFSDLLWGHNRLVPRVANWRRYSPYIGSYTSKFATCTCNSNVCIYLTLLYN